MHRLTHQSLAIPLAVAAATYLLAIGLPGGDPDTYWHLASGRWMVENQALLREDIFSHTIAGMPYSVGEWLGQIFLWLAYLGGGWAGVVALRAALVATAAFFLTRVARRLGAPPIIAVPLVGMALLLSMQNWGDRPQLFTLALFPLTLDLLLLVYVAPHRSRLLWLLPLVLVLWTNLHGGYALGLALIAIFALEALLARRAIGRDLLLVALVSTVATFLDPGALGLGAAANHALAPPRFIVEEMPLEVLRPAGLLFSAFVLAVLAGALFAPGHGRRATGLLEFLLLAPLLILALSAQRHLVFFVFAATGFIAAQLADLFKGATPLRTRLRLPAVPRGIATGVALVLVAGSLVATPLAPRDRDEEAYPTDAVAALRTGDGNLLHEYDWGGFLIWHVPERLVFIDGRLFPFLPEVLDDYNEMVSLRPQWRETLNRREIQQVLLRPWRPLVAALLDESWTVEVRSSEFVLLTRP